MNLKEQLHAKTIQGVDNATKELINQIFIAMEKRANAGLSTYNIMVTNEQQSLMPAVCKYFLEEGIKIETNDSVFVFSWT